MARTLIHESLHAYFLKLGYIGSDFLSNLNTIAIEKGFIGPGSLNDAHHEFMAAYVTAMAASLKRWDTTNGSGGTLGDDYYTSMAFGGLMIEANPNDGFTFNDAAKALINNPKENEILQIIFNEQEGNTDAKGEKCD